MTTTEKKPALVIEVTGLVQIRNLADDTLRGLEVIEKHLTIHRQTCPCPETKHSMEAVAEYRYALLEMSQRFERQDEKTQRFLATLSGDKTQQN